MTEHDSAEQALLRHQFPMLDTLRAVGALAVFTTHAAFWAGAYTDNGVWGTLLSRLDVGVAIFFVLSGFLLSRPHLAHAAVGQGPPAVGRYYWKRFLRIVPLYVLTVLIALGLIQKNADLGPRDWLVTLVMGNTFVDEELPHGLTHMWSLAVEATFYLVLPALMVVAIGRSRRLSPHRVVALVMVMIGVTVWWVLAGAPAAGEWSSGQPTQWLPAYLGWFGLGIFLALVELMHRRRLWPRLTDRVVFLGRQPGSCWAIIVGLMLVAATPLAGPSMLASPTPGQLLAKNVIYAMVGGLLVLTGVFSDPGGRYGRALGHHVARHLGFISYGIFCLHLPVLHLVLFVTGWELFDGRFLAIWVIALSASLLVAEAAYRLVEAPSLKLKDLGRRRAESVRADTTGTNTR